MLHIKSARYIEDFRVWVSFDDGTEGEINLENSFSGPVFEPLKQVDVFAKLSVDPELETIVWPNGADLAPEFLKELHNQQR
jgi:hypothetical protein